MRTKEELEEFRRDLMEEPEEVELFEYIYKEYEIWLISSTLYTEKEAKVEFEDQGYDYKKTGRSFKVPRD